MQMKFTRLYPSGFARWVYGEFDNSHSCDERVYGLIEKYQKGELKKPEAKLELVELWLELVGDFKTFLDCNDQNENLTNSGKSMLIDIIDLLNGKKQSISPSTRLALIEKEIQGNYPKKPLKAKLSSFLADQKKDHTKEILQHMTTDLLVGYLFVMFGYRGK